MKQAVIQTGGQQYIVSKNQELMIDLVGDKKQLTFHPLLVFDDDSADVGTPQVENAKVTAKVIDPDVKDEKVIAIRYKPKKRVHKRRGHRQRYSRVKITGITHQSSNTKSQSSTSKTKQKGSNPASSKTSKNGKTKTAQTA